MDLRWFEPDQARAFVDRCQDRGLLEATDDGLAPTFDVREVEVPLGFKPTLPGEATPLDDLLDRLVEEAGLDREQAVACVNQEQDRFGGLLDAQVAGLVVARSEGLDVTGEVRAYLQDRRE